MFKSRTGDRLSCQGYLVIFLIPCKCGNRNADYTAIVYFQILSNSLFIVPFDAIQTKLKFQLLINHK
jgi:hypothetical protein